MTDSDEEIYITQNSFISAEIAESDIRQLNAWVCPRLHDIMRERFRRDLWGMRLFEFLRVATFILVFESIQAFESSRSKTYHSYMNN